MTKSQFVDRVAADAGLGRQQAADAVDAALGVIEQTLARGGEVRLAPFGRFHAAEKAARRGADPRTGEPMTIAAMRVPRFTPGTRLKEAVGR